MKKASCILLMCSVLLAGSGCGTITQLGKTTPCQKAQKKGEVKKKPRVGILAIDFCLGFIPLVIDLATGAGYKKTTDECEKAGIKPTE